MPLLHKTRLYFLIAGVFYILAFLPCQLLAQKPLRFTTNTAAQTTTTNNKPKVLYNPQITFVKDKSSIKQSVEGFSKDGVFTQKSKKIGYTLKLQNTIKEPQNGIITMQIVNANGMVLHKEDYPFSVSKKGIYEKNYVFDANQLQAGYYACNMQIVTERYADTALYNFAYESDKIVYNNYKAPNDLVNFWQQAQNELAATPANINITPRTDIKNKSCDVYEVEFNSTDKADIFGWLSVPKHGKGFPVLYKISDYMSELAPEYRDNMAVLCINTRGTGASNTNYNYDYNNLGLVGIKDKNKYILKGIYLDALRGIEVIKQYGNNLKLNTNKILVTGSGLGASATAVVAALTPNLAGAILDNPTFMDMRTLLSINDGLSFPANMFKRIYGNNNSSKESLLNVLDYFDPVFFAPYINTPVLTGFGLKNNSAPAQSAYNFINQLRVAKKEKYICKTCNAGLDKGFYGLKETWIKEIFKQP